MPPKSSILPARATLYRMLERVTEAVARELARPGTPQPTDWGTSEWAMARAVAVMQGIGPLLASRATWTGEPGWREFLEAQREHVAARHTRLTETVHLIDRRAREAGLTLVALKGTALHRLGIYQPGERPMADIDLLARPREAEAVTALLEGLGFQAGVVGWKDQVFAATNAAPPQAFGEHADNPVKIELHRHIVERLPWWPVSLPVDLMAESRGLGVVPYPSRGALMLHLLMHAAGAMPTRTLRMMHLHDIAALAPTLSSEDWRWLMGACPQGWWCYPPLRLAARYYEASIPDEVCQAMRLRCPVPLARWADRLRLFDASHSYPWVEALPGIAWSRSLGERVAYLASRIRPGREMLARREALLASEAWTDRHWSRQSQWQRVLRFSAGRQARPSTMHAVHLAFGQRH